MKNKKLEKIVIALTAVFVIAAILLMFGGNFFSNKGDIRKTDSTVMPTATETTNEIKKSVVIEQDFVNTTDTISKVGIVFSRLAYKEGIDLAIELLDGNTVLAGNTYNVAGIEEQHRTYVEPASKLTGMSGKKLTLRIYPADKEDTGLVVMMDGNADSTFCFGSKTIKGTLCFSVTE